MSDLSMRNMNGRGLSRVRAGETTRFIVDDQKGYLTTASAADGGLGEVTIRMAKQGSTLAGMMDALGMTMSLGLQAGAPLEVYLNKYASMRFTPAGRTDDPDFPAATSLMDYLARRLAVDYLPDDVRADLGIYTDAERIMQADPEDGWADLAGMAMSAS